MQVKEMAPNTEYATLSGRMVVTYATVERGWYDWSERVHDDNTGQSTKVRRIEKGRPVRGADPWGGGGPDIKVRDGIHVLAFDNDETGGRVGKGVETVLRPEDIGGTWADYLALHGQAVKLRARERGLRTAEGTVAIRVRKALRDAGIRAKQRTSRYSAQTSDVEVYVETEPVYQDRTVVDHRHVTSITFTGRAVERLLSRLQEVSR